MLDNSQKVSLPEVFSKGMMYNQADTKMPYQYGQVTENLRLSDKVLRSRKGYTTIQNLVTGTIQAMKEYKDVVYVVANNHLFKLTNSLTVSTDLGSIGTSVTTPVITVMERYVMVFNGTASPVVYNTSTNSLTTISTLNTLNNQKPTVAETFRSYQFTDGSGTENSLLFCSAPYYATSPDFSCIYDFNSPVVVTTTVNKNDGTPVTTSTSSDLTITDTYPSTYTVNREVKGGVRIVPLDDNIVGIKGTLSRLYIFTDSSIHQIDPSLQDTGDIREDIIYKGTGPVNQQAIVSVNESLFFLTKDKQIKSIRYIAGTPLSQVVSLTEGNKNTIVQYLQDNLHDDQSKAFGYFYSTENLVKFHVRSKLSLTNDIVLIYDTENNSWSIDTNKKFSCSTPLNGKFYCGSAINAKIYQDEVGVTDDGAAITCKRKTKVFDFGADNIRKSLRELTITGKINLTTDIQVNIYVDGTLSKTIVLNKSLVSNSTVGIKTDNKLYQFRHLVSKGNLFEKGYLFEIEFIATGTNLDFVLSSLEATLTPIGDGAKVELYEK